MRDQREPAFTIALDGVRCWTVPAGQTAAITVTGHHSDGSPGSSISRSTH